MMGWGGGGHVGGGHIGGGSSDNWDEERLGVVYDHDVVRRLLPYLAPYRRWVAISLVGLALATATSVAMPLLIREAINRAIVRGDLGLLTLLSLTFLAATLVNAGGTWLQAIYMGRIAQGILLTLRNQLFRHLQSLSLSFYDRSYVGRLMSRVISDVEQVQAVLTGGLLGTLADLLTLVGIVAAMFWMNALLAAATLSVVPILIVIAVFWQARARAAFVNVRRAIAIVNGSLQENVSGVRVVQSLQREDENMGRFERLNRDHLDANLRASRLSAAMFPAVEAQVAVAMALVVFLGGALVLRGDMLVGDLVAFALFVQRFFDPIRNITMQYTELQRAMASSIRIFELLDTQPEVKDAPDAAMMPRIRGEIAFRDVSFSYRPGIPVLQGIDVAVRPGETVALVGPTGAGKSTFVSLVARFYDVTEGSVCIDGVDVRQIERQSLARQMGMVLQDPFLFSATVEENIRFGRPEASSEEVVAAAKAVGAHDVILRLEKGYQTVLHERGGNLSMGHRQLISFARAVLADPRILILDEATASIDTETEAVIQRGLRQLLRGRTSLVIAHRLSTIRNADRILVLDNGRIVEEGDHAQLVEQGGLYARLHALAYTKTGNLALAGESQALT